MVSVAVSTMLSLGACDGEDGDDYCEVCNLDVQVPLLAAEDAMDCGEVEPGGDASAVATCIEEALEAGSAFVARQRLQGIDSTIINAYLTDADGNVQRLSYDSNICGGGDCGGTCGPRISVAQCDSPRASMNPEDAIVGCDFSSGETLCEPPQ